MELFLRTGFLQVADRRFNTRMRFSIERMQGGLASGAVSVGIYNLNEESRSWLEDVKLTAALDRSKSVQVFAGYGDEPRLIFQGRYFHAWTERRGADLITALQLGTGIDLLQLAHVSFAGLVNALQVYEVLADEAAKYGIVRGFLSSSVRQSLQSTSYARAKSDAGSVSHMLDTLVRKNGLRWSLDGGALNIYSPSEYEDGDEFFLSSDTGMIGFPSKTQEQGYKVSCLLNPELIPGKKVLVRSQIFDQDTELKIVKLTHIGDTWEGGDWRTELLLARPGAYNFLLMSAS